MSIVIFGLPETIHAICLEIAQNHCQKRLATHVAAIMAIVSILAPSLGFFYIVTYSQVWLTEVGTFYI